MPRRTRPRRYSGLHPPRLPDADGAAFPTHGGRPGEARKLLGRLVSGDESDAPQITTAEDWHVGFEPGPGDNPADAAAPQARLLPQPGHHLARTHCAGDQRSRPDALVQILRRIHSPVPPRERNWWATPEPARRRTGSAALAREAISPGDAACHQPGSDDELQRPAMRRCSPKAVPFERSGVTTAWR